MVQISAMLGLRWGEVAALKVGSFDLLKRTVRIEESVARDRRGQSYLSPPKTESSIRTLAMPNELVSDVARYLTQLGINGANPDHLLFSTRTGRVLSYSRWRTRKWIPAREAVGAANLKFHDLRRWNATLMVTNGVDIRTAQHWLGHSDPRMTLAVYAQATPEADANAASRLGAAFAS